MNVQPISRAEGYSAVASAAYRTRSRMIDERLGQTFDWSRRRDELEHTGLVVPRAARGWLDARRGQSPAALRSQLWNAVEREEKRKDSKVARDCIVAMPWELSPAQRRTLNYWIARFLAERHGFAVEYSAHMPQLNAGEQHADQRNYHTHFMIPTRQLTAQGLGEKTRELDSPKTSGPHIEAWRAGIAALMNRALERAGVGERIDMRSYERRGMTTKGQWHMGPKAPALPRRGLETEAGAVNAIIQKINALREEDAALSRLTEDSNVIDFEAKRQQRDTRRMQAQLFRQSIENKDRMRTALEGQRRTEERLKSERIREAAAEAQRQREAQEAGRRAAEEQAEALRREQETAAREARERQAAENARSRSRLEGLRQRLQGAMVRRSIATPDRGEGMGWWGRITDGFRVGLERVGKLLSSPAEPPARETRPAVHQPPPLTGHTREPSRSPGPGFRREAQAPPEPAMDERDKQILARLQARRQAAQGRPSPALHKPQPQALPAEPRPAPPLDERDAATLAQLRARHRLSPVQAPRATGSRATAFERAASPPPSPADPEKSQEQRDADMLAQLRARRERGRPMPTEAQPANDNAGANAGGDAGMDERDRQTLARLQARRATGSRGAEFDRVSQPPADPEKSQEQRDADTLAQLRARRERGRTRGPEPPHREPERC